MKEFTKIRSICVCHYYNFDSHRPNQAKLIIYSECSIGPLCTSTLQITIWLVPEIVTLQINHYHVIYLLNNYLMSSSHAQWVLHLKSNKNMLITLISYHAICAIFNNNYFDVRWCQTVVWYFLRTCKTQFYHYSSISLVYIEISRKSKVFFWNYQFISSSGHLWN